MPEVLAVGLAIASLVLFRHYAARQIAARRGPFVWAFAFPMVLGPAVIVWAGMRLLSTSQMAGVALLVFGAGLGALEFGFFRRVSRAVSSTPRDRDLGDALTQPTADFMLIATVGGLIFGVSAGLALVVWAILTRGPGT
jgi:hypothetical protein